MLFKFNLSPKPIERNWWQATKNEALFRWKIILLKSFNTNEHQCNFIQNNSTLFWCFTLLVAFAYEQFSFLFTLKKEEFINRATLNLSARYETGSLYITSEKGLADHQTLQHAVLSRWSFATSTTHRPKPLSMTATLFFIKKNYKSMKFKSMKWSYLDRRQCVWTLSRYKIPARRKFFCFAYPDFFTPTKRTLNNFMGRRFNAECVAFLFIFSSDVNNDFPPFQWNIILVMETSFKVVRSSLEKKSELSFFSYGNILLILFF